MITAIEPLGKQDRASLSCGVPALDDWFRFRAGQDLSVNPVQNPGADKERI